MNNEISLLKPFYYVKHLIDIVIAIEEEFDIAIDDDSIGKINTVQEAMEVIVGKINEAA